MLSCGTHGHFWSDNTESDTIVGVGGLLILMAKCDTDSSCVIKLEYCWLLRSTKILL